MTNPTRYQSTITEKGQITIPAEIRKQLGLRPRDQVFFKIEGDHIILEPLESRILANFGAVKPRQRPEDFREIREEAEQAIADEAIDRSQQQ